MIQSEYFRFVQTLNVEGISADVRKIANLVLQHLETLTPLSTAQGQRIKKLAELAQKNWSSTSSDILPMQEQATKQTCQILQLEKLSVGPFRGFERQEDFDLANRLVLIYGPNGTGKSSFCEALEYGLLGYVAEAENRRFHNQNDYLKNAYTKNFKSPVIVGIDNHDNHVSISANEDLFRFCFIEKNRIDNFSRIAAQAPAKQMELISTLFGLEAFTDFVKNFSNALDNRYIDLKGIKSDELAQKRQTLAGHEQNLKNLIPEELKKIEEDEKNLVNQYRPNSTFSQMDSELNGTNDNVGMIQQLEEDLQKPIEKKSNLTIASLYTLKQSIEADIEELKTQKEELSRNSRQVSFKQLYDAVVQVHTSCPDQCPACHTPLTQVAINPFEHANSELKKLENLVQLEENIKRLEDNIRTLQTTLLDILKNCCSRFSENNKLSAFQFFTGNTTAIDWWNSFHKQSEDGFTPWQHLVTQVKKLEDSDKNSDTLEQMRTEKQKELSRLRNFSKEIITLQSRKKTANITKEKAEDAIAKFDTENATLIAEVEAEKIIIIQNQAISNAYSTFVKKLNDYKDSLPAKLVANLGETVVQLYNAFNRNDAAHEQLSSVRLPLQQNQRLEISFKKNPNTFFDALHILSEGHIRCIGLSILTAKNITENCSLLIFDDPVNAIDDEHRESIRRTLFEDSYFGDKQIILACHGEEFFKDIQNLLSRDNAQQAKMVSFLPKREGSHIRVDINCSPRNYIVASRNHYDKNEIRDALTKSRKALESLTKGKVWRYVRNYSDGNLSIKLCSVTAPIELRNLTEQLKSKIAKDNFSDLNKNTILNPLEALLGLRGDSREWKYLNKGTHEEEDRAEFDCQTVNEIVTALERLDAALVN